MEETSICHKEYLIGGLTQGTVVVALIEQAGLGRAGLGGERHDHRIAQRGKLPAQTGDKGGVWSCVLSKYELEVHIQPSIAFGAQIVLHRLHKIILNGHIIEYQTGQFVGKAPLLSKSGQVHQRRNIQAVGGGDQRRVIQIHQTTLRCNAVGEGC